MKKVLIIAVIPVICLLLLKCKDDNDPKQNDVLHRSYELTLSLNYETWPAATFTWTLTDTATLNVEVTDSIVTISNILNKDGTVIPISHTIVNGIETCTATWQKEDSPSGYIHITGVSGEIFLGGDQNIMLYLHVTSSDAKTPRFTYECTRSGSTATGGESLEPFVYNYTFMLNDQTQSQNYSILTATLTPN